MANFVSLLLRFVALWFILTTAAFAQAATDAQIVQQSIVYIYLDIVDSQTGAKSREQGTGFIISPEGHVLTAAHLFRAWRSQRQIDRENNPIHAMRGGKPGWVPGESPLVLNFVDPGNPDAEDVALLKLPSVIFSPVYRAAPICFSSAAAAKMGDEIIGYGFPQDSQIQPVRGTLGTRNAEGDRWTAEAAFTLGMSGGPVYSKTGVVIGIIKGGLENINAIRQITPIDHARKMLPTNFPEQCPDGPPALCVAVTLGGGGSTCITPGSGKSLRDCPDCPEMVVVPAGRFQMGSLENEEGRSGDEGPRHEVSIAAPFAMGQYEITVGQYLRCARERECRAPEWQEQGSPKTGSDHLYKQLDNALTGEALPIVGVSWRDAGTYAAWLSKKTGQTYRLPSEAVWEYAARAGTTGPFSFDGPVSTAKGKANYDDTPSTYGEGRGELFAVRSFQSNRWGLYQVHGNVWEWTQDCWKDSYNGAPADGDASTSGECDRRVIRGGSWSSPPEDLRSAARAGLQPDNRSFSFGFRLVRTLNP